MTLGPNSPSGTTLLAISRDGDVRRQVETDKNLGVPAVVGGLAFIPWGNQYVSVLDIVQGDEPARILLREKTSRAFAHGGELYFGEVGIFRFDEKIKDAPRNAATHVALPQRELPGTPLLFVPLDERTKLMGDARDRIHLYARPVVTDGDNLALAGKRLYSTYFKYVMGLDDTAGALAWVHTHAADVIGAAAGEEGLVVCDERGKVTFLEAMHGQPVGERDLGKPVKACVVSVGSLRMGRPTAPAAPLVEQLARALAIRDPQLAAAKQFLIAEVAKLDGEIATKSLLALVADAEGGAALDADVRAALAGRRSGARAMIAALERHYDFLGDVLKPPPVGAIAQALGAMKEKSAAPVLATHLLGPANSEADVKDVADALAVVAGPGEVPSLRQFFVLGYASAESEPLQSAVVAVAAPLLRHGGKEGAALVERAAAGGMTQPAIQEKLRALVAPPAEGKAAPAKESVPPAEK